MSPPIGPLPFAPIPEQPSFEGHCVAWTAFDVPRIWDVVAMENNPRGWEQVNGFRQLADLLVDHYRRLRRQHFHLGQAWQSPAASAMLEHIESLAEALLSDANCAQSTAHALHNIMTTYADARVKIDRIHARWNDVTTDWIPEWWDGAAEELNSEAQTVMVKTDEAVRDYRRRIYAPRVFDDVIDSGVAIIDDPPPADGMAHSFSANEPVPPIPGYEPYSTGPGLASTNGRLQPVPATPGQPISMLPVPPGSPYAPAGGAYILPGPGIGRGGFVVPMRGDGHANSSTSRSHSPQRQSVRAGTFSPVAAPGGAGTVPVPVGTTTPGVKENSDKVPYRRPSIVWQTEEGVPAIIEGLNVEPVHPDDEESFKEWFAALAYPWRSTSPRTTEPLIILRKSTE